MTLDAKPFDWTTELARLPGQPGVYRMYADDAGQDLIYIGKAKSLKNRVRSYFQKNAQHTPKVEAMVQQIRRFDYIVTDTEIEALILECTLIKRFRPKYNILLRDDKKFPWLALSNEAFPRIFMTRDPGKLPPKTRVFGPYVTTGSMYKTLKVIRQYFPMRQRRKPLFKNRPCMNYFLKTCPGPCQNLISPEDYEKTIKQVEMLLKGKADDLLEILTRDMYAASEAMAFERAAWLRDCHQAVSEVASQQKIFYADANISQDIIAATHNERRFAATVLTIRRGKLIGSRSCEVPLTFESTPEEAYSALIYQYYQDLPAEDRPDEVILQYPIEDEEFLLSWLNQDRKRKVMLTYPQKGTKKDLLAMAAKNAREALEQADLYEARQFANDPTRALMELQESLNLPDFPARMECYDISHFQGSQTVASMVVFTDGVPDKASYRRFKINSAEGQPDDFKSMAEVIRRRFAHSGKEDGWADPDLVIIDGGKGQLGAAVDVLREMDLSDQPIISLAKKFEEVYLPGQSRPVILPRDSAALFVLQRIRDEAHRFAITYHRTRRGKAATRSQLDEIPGVGEKTRQQLMQHFGSIAKLKKAPIEEIQSVKGINRRTAQVIYEAFHAGESSPTSPASQ